MVSGKSKEQDGEKMEVRTEMILCSLTLHWFGLLILPHPLVQFKIL